MSFDGLGLNVRGDLVAAFRDTWDHLARPGAAWSSRDRMALAAAARSARKGEPSRAQLPRSAISAASLLATEPAAARRAWVDELFDSGLGVHRYVELVGVVSRVVAVDTFCEALGLAPEPLPPPVPGDPTNAVAHDARQGKAWVPMVGGRSITQALSLVPSENSQLERLHGVMYLRFEEMDDPHISRGLNRPQMELIAARTSALNECFY